jgi:nucleoside-diphosphate-sugar epimerase
MPLRGSLEDLDSLKKGASDVDGIIHLGFINDFTNFANSCKVDKLAIETLGGALAETDRPLVVTAGVAGIRTGKVLTEDYSAGMIAKTVSPRKSEQTALAFKNGSVVRLPPSVYGDGKAGFVSVLIDTARKMGVSAYVGKGQNRWSAVHYKDAARVFTLALEKGTGGAIYHAVGDDGVTVKAIAEFVGQKLNMPVVSKSRLSAMAHFGAFFGMTAALDCPASSVITRNALAWKPAQPGLFQGLETWL